MTCSVDLYGNNKYCMGRDMWQYQILYRESYIAVFNIVLGDICGNIKILYREKYMAT